MPPSVTPRRKRDTPRDQNAASAVRRPSRRWLLVAALFLFSVVLVRTAWVTDDTYITYRVVDNCLHGYGLTWNTDERVQAYTHPLWLFLNLVFQSVTREAYLTGIVLSIAVSLSALVLLAFRVARTTNAALLGLLILLLSRAFVDYATSGLENPLTHLLLALFILTWFRTPRDVRRFFHLCAVAGLGILTRADFALLVGPALVVAAKGLPKRAALKTAVVAFLPVIAWETFSLVYYGSLVPNTAYAKLNTGIQRSELVTQGVHYLIESLRRDPLTLVVIAFGIAVPFLVRRERLVPLVFGIAAYLAYTVWIGGDFMSGRFLTPPLFAAVAVLSQFRFQSRRVLWPAAAAAVLTGLAPGRPTVTSGRSHGLEKRAMVRGIADEREFYFQHTGLFRADGKRGVDHPKATEGRGARGVGRSVQLGGMVGFLGYYSGPDAHILDGYALADPLLARLPERGIKWMIGHFAREIPAGYMLTLVRGENLIEDERIAEFYDAVRVVTRGPIFDGRRARVVWKMNTGGYDHLLQPFFQARRLQEDAVRELAAGRTDACIAAAERAVALDPRRAAAWSLISRASLQAGDLARASDCALKAAAIIPTIHATDALAVGDACEQQGDVAAAIAVYERLLEIDPKQAVAAERVSRLRGSPADR
ncbi:MAG TPA: glycosyltransferase family 39 protein [Candidatus Krumholzibacteria bacterium]|nr:glycosyltransferase family 39 protein [Candidatus Krumholzibacteria bacterium]